MTIKVICFNCKKEMEFVDTISRSDECPQCHTDVRCCKNCQFYDSKVYNECRETQADPVREKDRSNFCGFFTPSTGTAAQQGTAKESVLSAAEALFKKK